MNFLWKLSIARTLELCSWQMYIAIQPRRRTELMTVRPTHRRNEWFDFEFGIKIVLIAPPNNCSGKWRLKQSVGRINTMNVIFRNDRIKRLLDSTPCMECTSEADASICSQMEKSTQKLKPLCACVSKAHFCLARRKHCGRVRRFLSNSYTDEYVECYFNCCSYVSCRKVRRKEEQNTNIQNDTSGEWRH